MRTVEYEVTSLEWGFVVGTNPPPDDEQWTWVHEPAMGGGVAQFVRAAVAAPNAVAVDVCLALTSPVQIIARAALARRFEGARVVGVRRQATGVAEVHGDSGAADEVAAAAVAVTLASGAWDESDVFRVTVGAKDYLVRAHHDERWLASVVLAL